MDEETKQDSAMRQPPKPKYDLTELLSQITGENRHHETEWGPPVGKEEW